MTRARAMLAAIATAALLAGCTPEGNGPSDEADDGDVPESTAVAPAPDASSGEREAPSIESAEPPPPPEEGACYELTFDELARTSVTSEPVRCGRDHNAETIHVGRIDTGDGDPLALDSNRVRNQTARTCRDRLVRHLGGTREARNLSRFEVVWFMPTPQEGELGADRFRCDLVALAGEEQLHPLPRRSKGVLDRPRALATYGLCGTAAPGARRFERVICDRRHSWRAIATIRLPGGQRYPGVARVRAAGNAACRSTARAQANDPLQFRYGWEWPTREQWENGQRFGYCWVPA